MGHTNISLLNKKLNAWAGTKGIDYVNDISACFKWLMPKLKEDQKQWSKFIGYMCGEAKNASRKSRYSRVINWLSDPMNICLAIEKLINENKE